MKSLALLRAILFHTIILTGLVSCTRQSLTVDEVIDRNTEAVGGRLAIEAIHSVRFDLHIVDPSFTVDATYVAARPGSMRIDINAQGRNVYTEALNAAGAWQWKGSGEPIAASAQATAALRHGVELPGHLFGLHELADRGHHLELSGREEIDGINYYVLRLKLVDGYETTLFVDPRSWFITRRRDVRPLHPDVDPTPTTIENRMTDFRRVGHLLFAFASTDVDLATDQTLETTTIRSITLNPGLDPNVFDKL